MGVRCPWGRRCRRRMAARARRWGGTTIMALRWPLAGPSAGPLKVAIIHYGLIGHATCTVVSDSVGHMDGGWVRSMWVVRGAVSLQVTCGQDERRTIDRVHRPAPRPRVVLSEVRGMLHFRIPRVALALWGLLVLPPVLGSARLLARAYAYTVASPSSGDRASTSSSKARSGAGPGARGHARASPQQQHALSLIEALLAA